MYVKNYCVALKFCYFEVLLCKHASFFSVMFGFPQSVVVDT